jgi:hypothetical protein
MAEEEKEKEELVHEPVEGYPAAFYAVVAVALVYLGVIFIAGI